MLYVGVAVTVRFIQVRCNTACRIIWPGNISELRFKFDRSRIIQIQQTPKLSYQNQAILLDKEKKLKLIKLLTKMIPFLSNKNKDCMPEREPTVGKPDDYIPYQHCYTFTQKQKRKSLLPILFAVIFCCSVIIIIACVCMLIYFQLCMKALEEKLEAKVEAEVEKRLAEVLEKKFGNNAPTNEHQFGKHSEEKQALFDGSNSMDFRQIIRRSKRNVQRPTAMFIHMQGRDSQNIMDSESNFIWNYAEHRWSTGFGIVLDPRTGSASKIRIKERGAYLVYSQVAVHGQQSGNISQPVDCAHQTILKEPEKRKRVLLRSLITQYKLGASYDTNTMGESLHAIDTKLQMGVFHLKENDELFVSFSDHCHRVNYTMRPEHSYFGVARIG
ncbi:uncharacterized protein LOC131947117 isoform X2 [Physella acuta]|uniref:uncharacterized protein LOC131947117 isoform X2 n=1 Tax=Physella acuta TaxID=109671 RepID=UPI0027DE263A|nr:uncharacterized protein LOC131947117 isoform X2 [Physella acuta]